MATGNVVNGNFILLSVNGERVAALTANDETYSSAMRDTTVKESLGDSEFLPGLRSMDLNCSGLFLEQSKNMLKYTEGFDNSIWVKDTAVTVSTNVEAAPSPYNRKTVDLITFSTGAFIKQTITPSQGAGVDIDFSVWVKNTGAGTITIEVGDNTSAVVSSPITLTSTLVRYDVTYHTTTGVGCYVKINKGTASTVRVFGAQLELNTVASSYFPSGTKFGDLLSAQQAGTQLPCIVSSFVSGELTDSVNAYISNIKKTNSQNANVTFTCTLKASGSNTLTTV